MSIGERMTDPYRHKILLVDDEPMLRDTMAMVLKEEGYDVSTAVDGFDALAQLRRTMPDIIISDLNMPGMSGFELLAVVRVRFPHIPVVAMSGAYNSFDQFPESLIADAVYPKGRCRPAELEQIVAGLVRSTARRQELSKSQRVHAQTPVFRNDSGPVPSMKLTCTDCMRPFSIPFTQETQIDAQEANCEFCATAVRYLCRYSLAAILQEVFEATEAVREEVLVLGSMGSARCRPNARRTALTLAHR
jgi:CheY-like chemotaxis protein